MDIVVDFDGTCVKHEFPKVGEDIGAVPVLKALVANGHRLILFTMRSNVTAVETDEKGNVTYAARPYLDEAVKWFKSNDIPLYGVQTNPKQGRWTKSNKAYGHLYIDDAGLGMPLVPNPDPKGKKFVDWDAVRCLLENQGIL